MVQIDGIYFATSARTSQHKQARPSALHKNRIAGSGKLVADIRAGGNDRLDA
jgi:hypothetical protein